MDLQALKAEIDTDPLARGYAGMTDDQVADSLRAEDRDLWNNISSAQLFEAIDPAEFQALNNAQTARADRLLSLGSEIQTLPGSNARAEIIAVFGGGSNTVANLIPIARGSQSRARELGLGRVLTGDVTRARALP